MSQTTAENKTEVSKAFLELMNNKGDLQLNVEGVRIPHSFTVLGVDQRAMETVLKMQRPFASELPPGTPCRVSFGALGAHWKAILKLKGRVGHLQYSFELPEALEATGRREHKRYPFRPRENITVYVQNSGLPGMGASGALLDLSMGGMAFRPERAFRIEDGARLKLDTALFERGKSFPVISIDGLPKLDEPLKLRGEVAHVFEKSGTIFVAFVFGLLDTEQTEALSKVLAAREKMGGPSGGGAPSPVARPAEEPTPKAPKSQPPPAVGALPPSAQRAPTPPPATREIIGKQDAPEPEHQSAFPATLQRLARRSSSILLVKPGGAACERLIAFLKESGYVRVVHAESLDSHVAKANTTTDFMLVGIELGGGLDEPIRAFRNIHEQLADRKGQETVVLAEKIDQVLLMASEELSLPIGFTADPQWVEVLDNVLGIV